MGKVDREKNYRNDKLPVPTMKGSFWWRSLLRLLTCYKGIASVTVGTGDTTLFWKDLWNGRIL
jgi:hypothetical protein